MNRWFSVVAIAAVVAILALAVLSGSTAHSIAVAATYSAAPSPVVSVTTLPAVPAPPPAASPAATPSGVPSAAPPPPTPNAPPGTFIEVGGKVASPTVLTLKELERMRQTTLTMRIVDADGRHRFHTFTGVLLSDILSAVNPQLSGANANSTAYVMFVGLGGAAIVGFPEFVQTYEGKQVLIAYLEDTRPLATAGIAELIVPGDATRARFITGITKITIAEPGM